MSAEAEAYLRAAAVLAARRVLARHPPEGFEPAQLSDLSEWEVENLESLFEVVRETIEVSASTKLGFAPPPLVPPELLRAAFGSFNNPTSDMDRALASSKQRERIRRAVAEAEQDYDDFLTRLDADPLGTTAVTAMFTNETNRWVARRRRSLGISIAVFIVGTAILWYLILERGVGSTWFGALTTGGLAVGAWWAHRTFDPYEP